MDEQWRQLDSYQKGTPNGWEKIDVSNNCDISSFGNFRDRSTHKKIESHVINESRYPCVELTPTGTNTNQLVYVHRLVLFHFQDLLHPDFRLNPDQWIPHHLNNNSHDNRILNLGTYVFGR